MAAQQVDIQVTCDMYHMHVCMLINTTLTWTCKSGINPGKLTWVDLVSVHMAAIIILLQLAH